MIGAIAPIAFLVVATLIGIFQPGYQVSTQSVSDVAVGNFGWLMDANFFALGLSTIAFAVGLFRTLRRRSCAGTLLLVVVGLATFAAGLFPTDLKGAPQTSTGGVHNLLFLVVFLGLILSYPFTAFALRHEPDLRDLALPVALLSIVIFGALFVFIGFGSDPGDPLYGGAGLIERGLIAIAFGWMSLVGTRIIKRDARITLTTCHERTTA